MASKRRWNIYRIKSPWLRWPVAVMFSIASIVVYVALLIACAIIGAVQGAKDGVLDWWRFVDFRMLWASVTTWKSA